MSAHNSQLTHPTFTLGTAYTIDSLSVLDDILNLGTLIDGDPRTLPHTSDGDASLYVELADAYPTKQTTINGKSYTPPTDDWDYARLLITTIQPIPDKNPDLELSNTTPAPTTLEVIIDRVDFEYTIREHTTTQHQRTTPPDPDS